MIYLKYVLPLLLFASTAWAYKSSYMIVCPDSIRPGMEFIIKFNKLSDDLPKLRLYASIGTPVKDIASKDIIVKDAEDVILTLDISPDIFNDEYVLSIYGTDFSDKSMLFKNSTSLKFVEKRMSIFIQTDKAMYKPGQKVQFRAMATHPDLTIVNRNMSISIYDPNNNKIAQWLNVQKTSGVYQDSLQLSDQPPLGTWKIEVDFGSSSKTHEITVAEYVLPKFEVNVKLPSFGLFSDSFLSVTVEALYTFGKAVEGNGTLIISKPYNKIAYTEPFPINGVAKLDVSIKKLTDLFEYLGTLTVTAVVEEGLTTMQHNDSDVITYYNRAEKLIFMDGPTNFKPGLRYTAYLFLSDQDDKPLAARDSQVVISVTMSNGKFDLKPMSSTINVPRNGIVPFTFNVPSTIESVSISAEALGIKAYKYLSKFHSKYGTYIQVTVSTRNPQTGKSCSFKLRSTKKRIMVNYMIIAKGIVVKQGQIRMKRKTRTLKVMLTSIMPPSAKCVVYWVYKTEVIADSIKFNVKRNFDNKVDVEYTKPNGKRTTSSKPKNDINIRVKADAGSQCNVLTVDKSVLLLKSGNDITPEKVEEEMGQYESTPPTPCLGFICLRSFYPVPIGGDDVTAIFKNSGLLVLTDALVYQHFRFPMYLRKDGEPMIMEAAMAMDEAEMDDSAMGSNAPNQRVRSFFPETWIYESSIADSDGIAQISSTVPDTVTSWISSAFAVNKKSGLGVALDTAELTVFLKFFVRLDLPYSVVRSEQVVIQANVFNFFQEEITVDVTLQESKYFQVITPHRTLHGSVRLNFQNKKVVHTVTVQPGSGVAVYFPIVPTEIGNLDVVVSAKASRMVQDTVIKQLLVEPEGFEESYGIPVLIDLDESPSGSFNTTKYITLPEDVVPGSVRIQISAIGDLMGPSISGLSNLLRMPSGCGEQNMINFVPNIVVIKYLEAVNSIKPSDKNKATDFMKIGYQKELTYQHKDGSFSAFGESDASGSTWLTAFVAKSFAQAEPYIFIDPGVMKQSIGWLLSQYTKSGLFLEPGYVIHKEMQGGSASGERNLATYVIIALMEAKAAGFGASIPTLDSTLLSAMGVLTTAAQAMVVVDPLERSLIFELAITSYALALDGSPIVEDVLLRLKEVATEEDGTIFWMVDDEPELSNKMWIPPHRQARAQNIETTAYVLLTYSVLGRKIDGLPVMKWLVNQRNSYGGFGSTQDTVIALQALAEFAALIYEDDFNMNIEVEDPTVSFSHTFSITPVTALLYQSVKAPENSGQININATGSGMAMVEIAVSYNVMADPVPPLFKMKVFYSDEKLSGFKLKICFSWLGSGTSGMSVLEIKLLSGFTAEKSTISDLSILKRIEDGDKKLVIYLDRVQSDVTSCINIRMQRQEMVAGIQPAMIKLFDYYDPKKHVFLLYRPLLLGESNVCDVSDEICA